MSHKHNICQGRFSPKPFVLTSPVAKLAPMGVDFFSEITWKPKMNHLLLPVAIGVAASVTLPLPTFTADAIAAEPDAIASSDIPVAADPEPVAAADAAVEPTATTASMPVVDRSYVESSGALNFDPQPARSASSSSPAPTEQPSGEAKVAIGTAPTPAGKDLFAGGSESFVARTVGAAEGTRTADGGKTQNYHGHVDPGNGVWNRGTFSYQFGNSENLTADEADRRQLAKIKRIYESVMLPKAEQHGIAPLTLAEEINGIDLINQAPLCVTEAGGYIERLAAAKQKGMTGDEAILHARIWSFWDDGRGGWDAPGLRAYDDISKEESIRRDQDRRMAMIAKAMDAYTRENDAIAQKRNDGAIAQQPQQPTQVASAPMSQSYRNAIAATIISAERRATRG